MALRLYDSLEARLREFEPLVPGEVGMYVCGPTVQSSPHIGHLRSALSYDLWRRWLSYRGYKVTLVRNVTDIDDKILAFSARPGSDGGEEWWALAYRYELEFSAAYARLGIQPPTYEPRATASVQQMLDLIARLIDRGHAYPAPDGSGDVYFDTGSWPAYGALTRQSPADMVAAEDADPRGKRDPRDFALWKGRKADEPESASWASPWGPGRPGWHIECSAMSARYLGPQFDIHGGGLDLRFPHHENELAQTTAAGDGFARYWVHNGLVTVEGQKMSKSLGNSIFAADFLAEAPAVVIRYYLAATHYRSSLDYHEGALLEAEAALDRVRVFLERSARALERAGIAAERADVVPDAFAAALDDDLSTPEAFAVLHETVRAGNALLDVDSLPTVADRRAEVLAMVRVLGIDPLDAQWRAAEDGGAVGALAVLVERLIEERQAARGARDFARADQIRNELAEAGIVLEDSPAGTHWSIDG
ncbi:cysteine--tRNA ligase [Naasia aerilata]|uniref:Cysteine--tRNA ligase n=1 Tax=Naasia aerilata TaxID=1162966 RepID=A0ABM8G9L6_9MICO|nr:cysteine--tRNA ligase [Naasia aerilata]BDZ44846.1 cysteine--tRNA ligase [Naasia aerilata]